MGVVIALAIVLIYFLPIFIGRGKKHINGIAVLNLFLGWTVLGWVGAMIWAVSSPKKSS